MKEQKKLVSSSLINSYARKTMLGIILSSLIIGTAINYTIEKYNFCGIKSTLDSKIEKINRLEKRKKTLRLTLPKILKKAEFEDGKPGMSLEDSAVMASKLGYGGSFHGGEKAHLYIGEEGILYPRFPNIYMKIQKKARVSSGFGGQDTYYTSPIKVDDEKIVQYLSKD